MTANSRNQRAHNLVLHWLDSVKEKEISSTDRKNYAHELSILERLIPIPANGFRGVVLTAIIGKLLDETFSPFVNFYDCNPRSIFEQGIYYALSSRNIPCGKSDPLNVAKNIQKLDYDWAQGRRPQDAARAAVDYLTLLEKAWKNTKQRDQLLRLYFIVLSEYAASVERLNVPMATELAAVPLEAAQKLASMILECPEAGTIPQFIIGNLIRRLRDMPRFFGPALT